MGNIEMRGFTTIPEAPNRDHRGTLLDVGLRVAYNKSGTVQIGKIVSFKSKILPDNHYTWQLKFELVVSGEDGSTSKIKNPNSFVVI